MSFNFILLFFTLHYTTSTPLYHGDIPIEEYLLTHFGKSFKSGTLLYIIDDSASPTTTNHTTATQFTIFKFLNLHNILHSYINFNSTAKLAKHFQQTPSSLESIALFELNAQQLNDTNQTISLLTKLSHLYSLCIKCHPFIVLLQVEYSHFYKILQVAVKAVSSSFQSVLIVREKNQNTTVHINAQVNGCQQSKLFVPKLKNDFAKLKMNSVKECNLDAAQLNVSVNHWPPFCDLNRLPNGTIQLRFSLESELLRAFQAKYNFTVNLVDGKNVWGARVNGTWNGVVGDVFRGTSSLAMCGITRSYARMHVIDYSSYIFYDEVSFTMQMPRKVKHEWIEVKPFCWHIWASIGASFALVFIVLHCSFQRKEALLLEVVGICLNQSIRATKTQIRLSARLVYAVWIMSVLVFTTLYSSSFYSYLTLSQFEETIDTLEDLKKAAERDTHKIITMKDSTFHTMILNSDPENAVFHAIGRHLNRTQHRLFQDEREAFEMIDADSKVVSIGSTAYLKDRFHKKTKEYHVGRENLASFYTALVLAKRSPLIKPFDKIIKQMQETGQFQFWFQESSTIDENANLIMENIKVLQLDDVKSIFILWSIGLLISVVFFVLDWLLCLVDIKQTNYDNTLIHNKK